MKCELALEIKNLHACPGDALPKKLKVSKDIFHEAQIETITNEIDKDLAKETEKASTREKTKESIQPLYAFREENGKILFRLGGPYGKIAGLFKEAGGILYSQKTSGFTSSYKPLIKSLLILPQWAELADSEKIIIDKIPQILAGVSKSMIIQYYEMIPKCKAKLTINFPKNEKVRLEKLLKQIEGMPFGPKRRAEIKILKCNYIE